MQFLLPLLLMLAIFFLRQYLAKRQQNPFNNTRKHWPLQIREKILNPEEMDFFNALKKDLGTAFLIMPKIHLQSLVYAENSSSVQQFKAAMAGKYVDFAICLSADARLLCVIEFDDHIDDGRTAEEISDIEKFFDQAGIILLHYQAQFAYTKKDFAPIHQLYQQPQSK